MYRILEKKWDFDPVENHERVLWKGFCDKQIQIPKALGAVLRPSSRGQFGVLLHHMAVSLVTFLCLSFRRITESRNINQRENTCLACVRSWVWFLAPQKNGDWLFKNYFCMKRKNSFYRHGPGHLTSSEDILGGDTSRSFLLFCDQLLQLGSLKHLSLMASFMSSDILCHLAGLSAQRLTRISVWPCSLMVLSVFFQAQVVRPRFSSLSL